ncbi:MAG: trigger factor, partial [Longimicrobiales bacterium]|nr:trigger factor [Longimicrobiales bacterium]
KVPSSVVEKQYGPSIDQETIERLINSAYQEALQQHAFDPISQASVENVDYEADTDLTFEVEFEVRPEIALERLGGFKVEKPSPAVDEADLDRVIGRLREQNATWTPIEDGTPDEGDRVQVEITPLQTESGEEPEPRQYEVVLGSGEILDDIDAAIRTLEPGAEDEFSVELPATEEDEGEEEHRIRLKLISAEHPELPDADDAFAGELGDFESMEDLRDRVRSDLKEEAEREADREVRRQLIQNILEANPFDPPPSLVDQYLDSLMQAPEDADPAEVASAKQQARPAAEHAVRRMLVIDRVAEMESLRATEDDVNARIAEIAAQNEMQEAEVRRQLAQSGRLQALASDLMEKRVFEYLKSLSTIESEDE